MAKEAVESSVETGISRRLQPWQSLFAILSYCIGVYGVTDEKALILYGMILVALGFTMVSSYKHKEAIKQVVAPWLVEQLLSTVSEYLAPQLPETPEKGPEEPIYVSSKDALVDQLRAQITALEAAMNGKSDSSGGS